VLAWVISPSSAAQTTASPPTFVCFGLRFPVGRGARTQWRKRLDDIDVRQQLHTEHVFVLCEADFLERFITVSSDHGGPYGTQLLVRGRHADFIEFGAFDSVLHGLVLGGINGVGANKAQRPQPGRRLEPRENGDGLVLEALVPPRGLEEGELGGRDGHLACAHKGVELLEEMVAFGIGEGP
jgi:hypothetical protein